MGDRDQKFRPSTSVCERSARDASIDALDAAGVDRRDCNGRHSGPPVGALERAGEGAARGEADRRCKRSGSRVAFLSRRRLGACCDNWSGRLWLVVLVKILVNSLRAGSRAGEQKINMSRAKQGTNGSRGCPLVIGSINPTPIRK